MPTTSTTLRPYPIMSRHNVTTRSELFRVMDSLYDIPPTTLESRKDNSVSKGKKTKRNRAFSIKNNVKHLEVIRQHALSSIESLRNNMNCTVSKNIDALESMNRLICNSLPMGVDVEYGSDGTSFNIVRSVPHPNGKSELILQRTIDMVRNVPFPLSTYEHKLLAYNAIERLIKSKIDIFSNDYMSARNLPPRLNISESELKSIQYVSAYNPQEDIIESNKLNSDDFRRFVNESMDEIKSDFIKILTKKVDDRMQEYYPESTLSRDELFEDCDDDVIQF